MPEVCASVWMGAFLLVYPVICSVDVCSDCQSRAQTMFHKAYSSACLCSFFSSFFFLPLFLDLLSLQCIHSSWGVFVLNVALGFSQSFFFFLQFDSLTEKYVWTVSNCILTCVCILILPCLSSCQRCLLFCSKIIWKQMGANQRVPHHSVVTKTEHAHTQTHTHTRI